MQIRGAAFCVFVACSCALAQTDGVVVDRETGEVIPVEGVEDLANIEPRTPLTPPGPDVVLPADASALLVIDAPGSYFLTGNLNGGSGMCGIDIQASNVTVNLNGFSMVGLTGSVHAITSSTGGTNIRVLNGTIRGWDGDGIDLNNANSAQIEDVLVANVDGDGIVIGRGSVKCCQVRIAGGVGIRVIAGLGLVKDCRVEEAGGQGIDCGEHTVVSGCSATGAMLNGIRVGRGSTVENCTGSRNGLNGVATQNHSTIRGCAAFNNGANGIQAGNNSSVANCSASINLGNGIFAGDNCSVSDSSGNLNEGDGINVRSAGSVINCTGSENLLDGIDAGNESSVIGCAADGNEGYGVHVSSATVVETCSTSDNTLGGINASNNGVLVRGCTSRSNGAYGIRVSTDGTLLQNTVDSNGTVGILVGGSDNRVDGNHAADDVIEINGTNNTIVRNSAESYVDNGSGNQIATIQTDVNNMGPWDNLQY